MPTTKIHVDIPTPRKAKARRAKAVSTEAPKRRSRRPCSVMAYDKAGGIKSSMPYGMAEILYQLQTLVRSRDIPHKLLSPADGGGLCLLARKWQITISRCSDRYRIVAVDLTKADQPAKTSIVDCPSHVARDVGQMLARRLTIPIELPARAQPLVPAGEAKP
jgi:hypothetical protein